LERVLRDIRFRLLWRDFVPWRASNVFDAIFEALTPTQNKILGPTHLRGFSLCSGGPVVRAIHAVVQVVSSPSSPNKKNQNLGKLTFL
jgi:hypothetical protein